MIGADLSSLLEVEALGGKFYDRGVQDDPMAILKRYGVNTVRLRLWNDPYNADGVPYGAGGCDLACVIALAKRAKGLGLDWLLDFHYSDFWADPGKQVIPKGWQGLNEDGLAAAVGDFTAKTLAALKEAGVPPQMVAVGNEPASAPCGPATPPCR